MRVLTALLIPALAFCQMRERNPFTSERDIAEGQRLYLRNCRICHGARGESGGAVTRLGGTFRKHGNSDRDMFTVVWKGVAGTSMPGSQLDEDSIWKILAFVRTLGDGHSEAREVAKSAAPSKAVRAEQLEQPGRETG